MSRSTARAPARGQRSTQAQRSARTRSALLESAARGLSRYGYGKLVLEQVAREAGYTRGALYHQFRDKEDLALAVIHWVDETWRCEVGGLVDQQPDPVSALIALGAVIALAGQAPHDELLAVRAVAGVLGQSGGVLMTTPGYNLMGHGYSGVRRPDHRLAAAIWSALGDAASVVNVGAGTGSYEPHDRDVIAIEPSEVMIAQRPSNAAPAIKASAEALPLEDKSVDAALAVLTLQHWDNVERGLGELVRVARRRLVLVTMDVDVLAELWLIREYVPETLPAHAAGFPSIKWLLGALPRSTASPMPVPRECTDGFMAAFWGRPEAYLDPAIRSGTSPWHQLPRAVVTRAIGDLKKDLESGEWDRRHGHLRQQSTLDVGLRLIRAELP